MQLITQLSMGLILLRRSPREFKLKASVHNLRELLASSISQGDPSSGCIELALYMAIEWIY